MNEPHKHAMAAGNAAAARGLAPLPESGQRKYGEESASAGETAATGPEHGPTGMDETAPVRQKAGILTIRPHTGLSGDMFCCGLAAILFAGQGLDPLSDAANASLNELAGQIMPQLSGCVGLARKFVQGIGGYCLSVALPHVHEHRGLPEIRSIFQASGLDGAVKSLAIDCFANLAVCEAAVHGKTIDETHFHEVGALDSILDIGLTCALYHKLGAPEIVCGALPLADGQIHCAHGLLPAPAPAVLAMLPGMRVRPFADPDAGELITPTALALLHALNAAFGPWPEFSIEQTALVYGQREFPNTPNGVIFALGRP